MSGGLLLSAIIVYLYVGQCLSLRRAVVVQEAHRGGVGRAVRAPPVSQGWTPRRVLSAFTEIAVHDAWAPTVGSSPCPCATRGS